MAPTYKFTYFDLMGIGEACRLLMKYGEIKFEDVRITFEQWPEIKPTLPFGQLPVLEVDGKRYTQSLTIGRYLAKKVKLVGKDDFEDMEIESIVETINDMRIKYSTYFWEQDAEQKEKLKKTFFDETLPYYFERLNKIAGKNNGHLACNKLTWADLFFLGAIDYLYAATGEDLMAKYPNLQAVKKNVLAIPAIKKYVSVRPKTDF